MNPYLLNSHKGPDWTDAKCFSPSVHEGSGAERETAGVRETHSGDDCHVGRETPKDRGDCHCVYMCYKQDFNFYYFISFMQNVECDFHCPGLQERQKQLESMGISLETSGIKVGEDKCFLVNLNADPALNELLVYYLKVIYNVLFNPEMGFYNGTTLSLSCSSFLLGHRGVFSIIITK